MLNYILWDVSPELIEGFRVRWYGLLFAVGFIGSYYVLKYIFTKEGKTIKMLDSFTFTAFVSLILGLRLGHCFFYEPAYYLANPLKILYVWEGGLASHGGAIGMLIGFFIFSRKHKVDYIWIVSRAAIVIPITAATVRLGNLMNSEIYGVATTLPWGFVFLRDAVINIKADDLIMIMTDNNLIEQSRLPILMEFITKNTTMFNKGVAYPLLIEVFEKYNLILPEKTNIFNTILLKKGYLSANHPTQIYEAIAYVITFVVLFGNYVMKIKKGIYINSGKMLGVMLIMIFVSRFLIEYVKNVQVGFEQDLPIVMGQILSIPFILLGSKIIDSMLQYALLGGVIGARLGHCLFYEPQYYLSNPIEILYVWKGGLASHGGVIGVIVGFIILSKVSKFSLVWLISRALIVAPIAAAFIRIGNLMNSEIYGIETSLPWGFIFESSPEVLNGIEAAVPRHPTQIYEAALYLITGAWLIIYYLRNSASINNFKIIAYAFFGIFISRFIIEFFKIEQVSFEEGMLLNMGQLLSIPFILAGIVMLFIKNKNEEEDEFNIEDEFEDEVNERT
ncbi:MAG: prolipoprotein diacylglyceryl transferase [Bacteroidales bacterium]|nr:prolipoprotein diacylglyceryl transferase [Bacteroidales bacterium]